MINYKVCIKYNYYCFILLV